MQVQVNIEFEQLVKAAKKLPTKQWTKLKTEVETQPKTKKAKSELLEFLLTAPTFSEKQLKEIAKTRKAINQWRSKPL